MPSNLSIHAIGSRPGLLLLFSFLYDAKLPAQEYLYKYFTMHDGLPPGYVTAMYFDKAGVFWMGTDKGLCYFDGVKVSVHTADMGLGNNMVYGIIEDDNGTIWAGGYHATGWRTGYNNMCISRHWLCHTPNG